MNLDSEINRIIHGPLRLMVLVNLSQHDCSFILLKNKLNVTSGNLSRQMDRLEKVGYLSTTKTFKDKRTHTVFSITKLGRNELERYKNNLFDILSCIHK